ncbi:hypothetical protein HanRHA438_Chr04g0180961 [Helianthus annuus]|nr:hypothetical protein HanRHA438_Chr04g0180961 [Helianthus annuus]
MGIYTSAFYGADRWRFQVVMGGDSKFVCVRYEHREVKLYHLMSEPSPKILKIFFGPR